ncbi:unnamed protein product [Lampetra planeri]
MPPEPSRSPPGASRQPGDDSIVLLLLFPIARTGGAARLSFRGGGGSRSDFDERRVRACTRVSVSACACPVSVREAGARAPTGKCG